MITEYSDYSEEESYQAREYKKWLASRPKCDYCEEPIEEDFAYELDNQLICESCLLDYMRDYHRKRIGF